ncbi:MAG: Efflux transporter, RND family, MFP subunit [uncultured bacterium]|nr:MAG: Efflux transporter, RND family, MFP subunit [uncultured bacterium]
MAVAIREYQEIAKTAPSLKETAITRLKHLGLSAEEIKMLPLNEDLSSHYHLQSGIGPLWIYATLFENDASYIKGGENVEIETGGNNNQIIHGVLKSLSPIVDASTRTIRARIEVASPDERKNLRPDSFVTAKIKIPLGKQIIIPKSALIDTGERQLVYIKQGDSHFQAQEISLGGELGDEWIIKEGLKVGDLIVINATFLVDSETRLQGN